MITERSAASSRSVLVVGLGDLGARVANALVRLPDVVRLVVAARRLEAAEALAGQLRLIAALSRASKTVRAIRLDLNEESTAETLQQVRPDLIVMAAARATWWRPVSTDDARADGLATLPYGAWLPVHASLVRRFMVSYRASGIRAIVVSLPFPDAVGPVLAPAGLAPHLGAGNVDEVAAKLAVLAASERGVPPEAVSVRLVMHHAVERVSFSAFSGLAGAQPAVDEPPWLARVTVGDEPLQQEEISSLLRAPYPLPSGVGSQELTAAAAGRMVEDLLAGEPRLTHAPGPMGLPGGYPIRIDRGSIALDLPAAITRDEAISVNARAARWDGIAGIDATGTITFTEAVANATERVLGLRLHRVTPEDLDAVADEMLERAQN